MKAIAVVPFVLLAVLATTSSARSGGTIDATQYIPIGAFNAWEMIDKDLWAGGAGVKDESQVISVQKVTVVDGITRYNVRTKFFQNVQDIIFVIGIDEGVVYLYGARIVGGVDLGDDDIEVPTVFFEPAVALGNTTTPVGADFVVQPITSSIDVSIDIGPKDLSGKVFITGTVTSRWDSVADIVTPLGTLSDLAQLSIHCEFDYSSNNEDIHDAVDDEHTSKGVSAVFGPDIGYVQIDGQGSQQKIVNRVILPGELLSGEGELDAFPPLPPGDLASLSLDIPEIVSLDAAEEAVADGAITDGVLTLNDIDIAHGLGGALVITGQLSAQAAPVELILAGKARMNGATGGLKIVLKGKTKKLTDFAKVVSFSAVQELPPPFDGSTPLLLNYKAGKNPETGEPILGTLEVPLAPFVGNHVDLTVNLPVDVAKIKKDLLFINTVKRSLGAEGVLVLSNSGDGGTLSFPVILRETAVVKDGLPTVRTYGLMQTGFTIKFLKGAATSTAPEDFALTKLSGKLLAVKVLPAVEEVVVVSQ
jgi:hypothetical protein